MEKGNAYAFVIYFPSAKLAGRLIPFPFFSFDEASLKKVAIQRLLGGMETGSYRDEIQSFPVGTRLISIDEPGGTLTLTFSKELLTGGNADGRGGMLRSIMLTIKQFDGVKTVRIVTEGRTQALDVRGADDSAIVELAPPQLLSVTAMQGKGTNEVEEVNAFFDRPVDIRKLQMSIPDGVMFEGDVYHSAFDMAAVLKPREPGLFKAGLPVKVRWKVVDKLGRLGEGDAIWPLEVKRHDQ